MASDTHLHRLLEDVIGAGLSTGSGVYAGVDPDLSMRLNERGEYEYVGLDAQYSGAADKLLAVSAFGGISPHEGEVARRLYGSQDGVQHDPIAGYYTGAFAGWVSDSAARGEGSSGGIATWILCELMNRGEIDGVVHLKPGGPDGQLFTYQISRTIDEVEAGAKSRYFPGELSNVLREIRDVPGRYAIVGIPSFIYEVRLLQKIEPIFEDRIAFTIGLVCGHQKSANYARYLAWRGGVELGTLQEIDFRKKVEGEPANRYATELCGVVDGRHGRIVVPQTELFGTDWGLGLFKSNFSDFTQDALNETADLVLGDAWLPRYVSDGRGTNVVLVRDARIARVLEEARDAGQLYLERISVSDINRSQSSLLRQSIFEVPYRFKYLARRGENVPVVRRDGMTQHLTFERRWTQRARLATSRISHDAFLAAVRSGSLATFDRRMMRSTQWYRVVQRIAKVRRILTGAFRALTRAGRE